MMATRILIIEGEAFLREALIETFRRAGFAVADALDYQQALAEVVETNFFVLRLCHLANTNSRKMYQWKPQTKAVLAAIDELRTCFVNIIASAESLDAMLGDHDTALRGLVQGSSRLLNADEKLSQSYQVCGLLAWSSKNGYKR